MRESVDKEQKKPRIQKTDQKGGEERKKQYIPFQNSDFGLNLGWGYIQQRLKLVLNIATVFFFPPEVSGSNKLEIKNKTKLMLHHVYFENAPNIASLIREWPHFFFSWDFIKNVEISRVKVVFFTVIHSVNRCELFLSLYSRSATY